MKNKNRKNERYSTKEVLIAIAAWIVVPTFGLFLCVLSIYFAGAFAEGGDNAQLSGVRAGYVFSSSGILILVPLILLCGYVMRRRWSVFARQARTVFCVGVIIYGGALVITATMALTGYASLSSDQPKNACTTLQEQYQAASRAVVPIATDKSTGTAFAVRDGSTLITAYHVIKDAKEVYATWTSGRVNISIISAAPEYDLALLKIDTPVDTFLSLSSVYDVTDDLYVLGWPGNTFTAGQASVSKGVVSRILTNDDLKLNSNETPAGLEIIQTDAAVNPGNSGGPVIGRCGVIGVAQSISDSSELHEYVGVVSEQGISYAISAKTASEKLALPLVEN